MPGLTQGRLQGKTEEIITTYPWRKDSATTLDVFKNS
jgi:hypothetical protein